MARRKKSTRRRRSGRRMGAMAKGTVTQALGIIAGAIAGKMVAKALPATIDDRIKNGAVVAAGIFFPQIIKGDLGKAIGNGMIAAGGAGLVGSIVPALGQAEDVMEFPVTVGEIPDNLSVIAGDDSVMAGDNLSVLAGYDEDDLY